MLACCRDGDEAVRRTAVEQLPFFEDARIFAALEWAITHDTAAVRAAAASALARVEHPSRTAALLRALGDADPWVRFVTLRSLGSIGAAEAVTPVLAAVEHDPAPHVRLAAIEVIGRISPSEALDVLEPLTRSPNRDIARSAVAALGNVNRDEALTILEQHSRAPDVSTRLAAVEALARRRETRVPQMLQWMAAVDLYAGGRRGGARRAWPRRQARQRAGQRRGAGVDRADRRTGAPRGGDRCPQQPADAPHRRYRRRPATCVHRRALCERGGVGTHEAVRGVAGARVGARRSRPAWSD